MIRYDRLVRQPAAWLWVVVATGCASILDIDGHYVAVTGDGGHGSRSRDAGTGGVPDAARGESGGAGGSSTRASGGSESGGAKATGGMTGLGGTIASAGDTGSTGGATVSDCAMSGCGEGQKCCGGPKAMGSSCYVPSPGVGCSETQCDNPCTDPVPANSTPSCSAGKCSFTCDPGFVEDSGLCVAKSMGGAGGGGAGGKNGTGGSMSSSTGGSTSTTCKNDDDCTVSCGAAGPFPCCMTMLNHKCGCTFFQLQVGNAPPLGYCLPRPPGF